MKIFGLMMAFLILALNVLPCADNDCKGAGTESSNIATYNSNHADSHVDACSPFCNCSCCATISVNWTPDTIESICPLNTSVYCTIVSPRLYAAAFSVWQPPQLV